jgi:hypothetical protein
MIKKIVTLALPVLLAMAALSSVPAASIAAGIKPQLCEYEKCGGSPSALEAATVHAASDFGGFASGEYCTGPYENVVGKTQYACYGSDTNGFTWQVNVGPDGEQTYSHKS